MVLTQPRTDLSLAQRLRLRNRLLVTASRRSVRDYLGVVTIDCRPEPRPFAMVAEPWQWEICNALCPAVEAVGGLNPDYDGPRCFWLTLCRGSDKTSLLARVVNWVVAFAQHRTKLRAIGAAADKDQAALLRDHMKREAALNPWFAQFVKYNRYDVSGDGGTFKCLSADAPSSYGLLADLFVADEIHAWPKRDLWDSLWSSKQKRREAILVVITNAGYRDSWQYEILQWARETPKMWWVYEAKPGVLPGWLDAAQAAEEMLALPPNVKRRLWDSIWTNRADESSPLTRAEIDRCEDFGRELGLVERDTPIEGITKYVATIDYGPKNDRTVLCLGHRDPRFDERYIVDRMDVIQGSEKQPVSFERLHAWLEKIVSAFGPRNVTLVVDPYELMELAERWRRRITVKEFQFAAGAGNHEMAVALQTAIVNRYVAWYPDAGLLNVSGRKAYEHLRGGKETLADELERLVWKETSYGWRFDHLNTLHDDRACALGMLLVELRRHKAKRQIQLWA